MQAFYGVGPCPRQPAWTPRLRAAAAVSAPVSAPVLPDVAWAVVVDGRHVRAPPATNISAEYDEVLATWVAAYSARVLTDAEVLRADLRAFDALLCFEPGTWRMLDAVSTRIAAWQASSVGTRAIVVYSDDVHLVTRAAWLAGKLRADATVLAAAYPEVVAGVPCRAPVLHWPHAAAAVFGAAAAAAAATEHCREHPPRAPRCLVAGQAPDPAAYPLRYAAKAAAALAARAAHTAGGCPSSSCPFVAAPDPDYATGARVPPEELAAMARACGAALVDGGAMGVLVAKHFEFAAAGATVLTDVRAAAKAAAVGLHCVGVASVEDAVTWLASAAVTDPADRAAAVRANVACVAARHTVGARAAAMYTLVAMLVHGLWSAADVAAAARPAYEFTVAAPTLCCEHD
jgi:hypothetical protein